MPIESNIDELERLILEQTDYIKKDVPAQFTKLVSEINLELNSAFNDGTLQERTGKLRKSIRVKLEDYGLTISMLAYGYFQSFGVTGTKGGSSIGLPEEVATTFGVQENYKFKFKSKVISADSGLPYPARKKIAEYGIKPKEFYPMDLEDKIIQILSNNG